MANTMSKYGSNTNRPLSEIVGLSTDTKPTDSIEGIQIQNGSSFRELDTGKRFLFDAENTTWNEVSSGGGGGSTLIEKSISANGVYNASSDNADGYSKVTVNVPSGDVEFKNTPTNFSLNTNIDNLDVIIPYGCTSIAESAFANCTGLTSIEIPDSVTSIGESAFNNCTGLTSIEIPDSVTSINNFTFNGCTGLTSIEIPNSCTSINNVVFNGCVNLEKIYVNKDTNTISGSPWGAPNTTQVIWRTNRYQSSCTEVASGTTLTGTVNATVGDLVVATFEIFGSSYSISEGWTLLGDGIVTGSGNYSQKTGMAYKIATSTTESFTITQDISKRAFISMVSITGASIGSFSGYTAQTDGISITMNKPNGLTIWSASSVWWGTGWSISNGGDNLNISTTRNLLSLDQSNSASVTFTNNGATSPSGILAASLTITGIDNFWYYDD